MQARLIAAAVGVYLASAANAGITLPFVGITNNHPDSTAIGEAQMSVTIDEFNGMARFTFNNAGPEASSIARIYFDHIALLGSPTIENGAGVNYAPGAAPPNLPGGNTVSPPFVADLAFSAVAPPPQNGVNPNEFVRLLFSLQGGHTIDDVFDQINAGDLRIGIHVIAFDNGASEAFINVPAPATLAVAGLAPALLRRRRR